MENVIQFRGPRPPANDTTESPLVFEVKAYEDGRVTIWLQHDTQTPEQFNWIFGCLALASEAFLDAKRERLGEKQ